MSRLGEIRGPYVQTCIPDAVRFWLHVWPRGDCWEWRGRKNPDGYGIFSQGKYDWSFAHRFAFSCVKALHWTTRLDHSCNHRWCVRPSHLAVASIQENTLRGDGPTAQNAKRTHCKRGHELQVVPWRREWRYCPTCERKRRQEVRNQEKRAPAKTLNSLGDIFKAKGLI